jgi:hypothetical protein
MMLHIQIIMRHIFHIVFQGPVSEAKAGVDVIFHAKKNDNSIHGGLMLTETKFALSCRFIPRY